MLLEKYKHHFAKILKDQTDLSTQKIVEVIEIPPENIPGDFAFPCFQLSKKLKKSPTDIALQLKGLLKSKYFSKFENIGGYVNAHIASKEFIADRQTEEEITPADHGNENIKVLLEYMGANPNKPLHIGHVRNVCIGDSLRRIFKSLGYNLTASTYGDDS